MMKKQWLLILGLVVGMLAGSVVTGFSSGNDPLQERIDYLNRVYSLHNLLTKAGGPIGTHMATSAQAEALYVIIEQNKTMIAQNEQIISALEAGN